MNEIYTKNDIIEHFDLKMENMEHFIPNHELQLPEEFSIIYVNGSSGSGKSLLKNKILTEKNCYEVEDEYDEELSVIEVVPMLRYLMGVGLNSVPRWVNPIKYLSDGERFRFNIAFALYKNRDNDKIILIDEYCSKVDIPTSLSVSHRLRKIVKKENKKIIVFGLFNHFEKYLKQDLKYITDNKELIRHEFPNPQLELEISFDTEWKTSKKNWKNMFSQHHYLNDNLQPCFIFTLWCNGEICGHLSYRYILTRDFGKWSQVHRLVILPKYQGLGLGFQFLERMMGILQFSYPEKIFQITTSHKKMFGVMRKNEDKWYWKKKNFVVRCDYQPRDGKVYSKNDNRRIDTFEWKRIPFEIDNPFTGMVCGVKKKTPWSYKFNYDLQ